MIQKNLNTNIELVDKLIKLTEEDITHIQQGRHDTVAQSVKDKNKLIALFEVSKKELDEILIKLSDNGTKNIAEILDNDDKAKLGEFKKKLEDNLNIEVIMQDERLSSVEANNIMISGGVTRKKRKKSVDSLAANIILQSYLDKRKEDNNE